MVDFLIPWGGPGACGGWPACPFIRNVGAAMSVQLEVANIMEAEANPPNRKQGTGPADRVVHQSGVPGTSTVETPDYHSRAEK